MPGGNGYLKNADNSGLQMPLPYGATLGRVAGHSRMAVYGHTPTPTAGTDVWEGGGAYPFQMAASKLEALSGSANDTAAGTGARTFTINGLDANFNSISETVTLNGVTPVQTANSYMRVNSFLIASAGSGNVNSGDVTLRLTGAGATQAIARAGYGFAKSCVFTVPMGVTLLVTDVLPECGGAGTNANVVLGFTRFSPSGLIQTTNEYNASPGLPAQRTVITGAMVPSTWAVTLRVKSSSGSPPEAFASLNGILVDNTQLT